MEAVTVIIFTLLIAIFCGAISNEIAKRKYVEGGFWWGFFLLILGIIVVALMPYGRKRNRREKRIRSKSDADELKKFKELLDSGVITQKEFDEKKKQLLGR